MVTASGVHHPRAGAFWGQLAETEHAVQVYRDDSTVLDSLQGFVGSGLRSGESVIVIATATHLHELEKRLRLGWIDLDRCRWEDRYIAVLAQETLGRFMVDGLPVEALFEKVVGDVIARARGRGRKLRAFGEMVRAVGGRQQERRAAPRAPVDAVAGPREIPPLVRVFARPTQAVEHRVGHPDDLRGALAHRSRVRLSL